MANINETIANVEKLDPELAHQLRKYVRDHSYGLVFEHNLPEAVRLYTKPAAVGDTVNIRPDRGQQEKDENKTPWEVKSIEDGQATIENGEESKTVAVEDIVPIVSYRDVIYPGLREVDRIERGEADDPYQVVINSENYHALEMLTYCYAGKVDCIYIDPPYNTGAKDWKYNNDYVDGNDQYRHSKWLAFMERRLKLAKQLLNPKDSVLIVTIDEKEYTRLGLLLEQMFPEADIEMITTVINARGKQRDGKFARTEEYVFFLKFGSASIHQIKDEDYDTGSSVPWRTMRRSSLAGARGKHGKGACGPNQFFPVYISDEGKIVDIGKSIPEDMNISDLDVPDGMTAVFPIRDDGTEMNWGVTDGLAVELWKKGYIRVGKHKPDKPQKWELSYLTAGKIGDIESGKASIIGKNKDGSVNAVYVESKLKSPSSVWDSPAYNAETQGTNMLKSLFNGDSRFTYPKSLYVVYDCLGLVLEDKPNALVIDFFAGSGTTMHAINLMNAKDDGNRRCICVTNNEVSAEETDAFISMNYRPGDDEWEEHGIARYITWPRTKCTIAGVDTVGNALIGDYGCSIESYEEIDADVIDPENGKKIRGKVYKKGKRSVYPEFADMKMADGFKANAVFFDLTYESAWPIRLDNAFDAIAPILWMQAGCKGPIIHRVGKSYLTTDNYGVLFDYNQASKFVDAVKKKDLKTVFVVTDDQRRYSNMCRRLPGVEVHRLYESFLKTFEICGEGGA